MTCVLMTSWIHLRKMNYDLGKLSVGVQAGIVINSKILLVRRTYKGSRWQLPGGFIEYDESPIEALKRECLEELNLSIISTDFVGSYLRCKDHNITYLYTANIGTQQEVISCIEIDRAKYFEINALPDHMSRRNRDMALDVLRGVRYRLVFYRC